MDELVSERSQLQDEVYRLQRDSARKEQLNRANQNKELGLKNLLPDGLNAGILKSSQHARDEHEAKSSRETQYRALYLRAKEDYEKLSKAYLKLKQSHAVTKNRLRDWDVHNDDLLHERTEEIAVRDTTIPENTCYSGMSRTSSAKFSPGLSPRPTSDVSEPCSSALPELRREDQALSRDTGTKAVVEEEICKDRYPPGDPPDEIAKNLALPQDELQAKHQSTKLTKKSTDAKAPEVKQLCIWKPLSQNCSDEPIVISERSLKRKRPGPKQHTVSDVPKDANTSNEGLTNSVRIKSDHGYSSPLSNLAYQSLAKTNESIDLDDVGDRTLTPRKRRRIWACLHGKEDISYTTKDGDSANLLAKAAMQMKPPRSPRGRTGHRSGTPNSPHKSRLSSQDRFWGSVATSGQTVRNILGPVDQNKKMLPRTSNSTSKQQHALQIPRKSRESTFGVNYGLPSRDVSRATTQTKWLAQGADFLLDCDSEISTSRSNSPSSNSYLETEREHAETVSVLEAREQPRDLPLSKLYPEDFRLNPQYNQGLDHAYSEVIRGRDARKCMNGCTRPGCCGTLLRKAIKIGGYIDPKRTRISNAIQEEEAEEDQDLLDEYLGGVKHQLKAMPQDQRKELLLKAQTEKFAKQYGKHRCAFGRPSTPPGFWNPDMPTTQEEVENRKRAKEMEREKVEEMYRETKRPNGRYSLRDEVQLG